MEACLVGAYAYDPETGLDMACYAGAFSEPRASAAGRFASCFVFAAGEAASAGCASSSWSSTEGQDKGTTCGAMIIRADGTSYPASCSNREKRDASRNVTSIGCSPGASAAYEEDARRRNHSHIFVDSDLEGKGARCAATGNHTRSEPLVIDLSGDLRCVGDLDGDGWPDHVHVACAYDQIDKSPEEKERGCAAGASAGPVGGRCDMVDDKDLLDLVEMEVRELRCAAWGDHDDDGIPDVEAACAVGTGATWPSARFRCGPGDGDCDDTRCAASIPPRDKEKPFLMPVEDLFAAHGHCATDPVNVDGAGRAPAGAWCSAGKTVGAGVVSEIVERRAGASSGCGGGASLRKLLDEGKAGDNVAAACGAEAFAQDCRTVEDPRVGPVTRCETTACAASLDARPEAPPTARSCLA